MLDYLPFLIVLMVVSAFIQADSVMTIFYMIIGAFFGGIWWNKAAIKRIKIDRSFEDHAFNSQNIPIELIIKNTSILPIIWLELHESMPVQLSSGSKFNHVVSLKPKETKTFTYQLYAYKRGYYPVGPLLVRSGDVLGITKPAEITFESNCLTVYPRIEPLHRLGLPSHSPFGIIKHKNPIFEDPSRIYGKRDYQVGDSLRRIDWKTSASTGQLQVKQFEASIDMEITILLDLHIDSYAMEKRYDATELAITTAASIANWSTQHKQAVGLFTNGLDPLTEQADASFLRPQKGNQYLMGILEALSRLSVSTSITLTELIQQGQAKLNWGATLILITGFYPPTLLEQIIQARKNGLNIVLILIGHVPNHIEADAHARQFGFTFYYVRNLLDMRAMEA